MVLTMERPPAMALMEPRTQPMAKRIPATIKLTLVARCTADGVSTEVEIPYTIVIQNYDKTTTEGGN